MLTETQITELQLLTRDPKNGTSNRIRDRARIALKRKGLIRFDRNAWTWEVLEAGRAALEEKQG
jgi:hypothetical protein